MMVLIQERGRRVEIAADVVEQQGSKPRGGRRNATTSVSASSPACSPISTPSDLSWSSVAYSSAPAVGDAASIAAILARNPSASRIQSTAFHTPRGRPRCIGSQAGQKDTGVKLFSDLSHHLHAQGTVRFLEPLPVGESRGAKRRGFAGTQRRGARNAEEAGRKPFEARRRRSPKQRRRSADKGGRRPALAAAPCGAAPPSSAPRGSPTTRRRLDGP